MSLTCFVKLYYMADIIESFDNNDCGCSAKVFAIFKVFLCCLNLEKLVRTCFCQITVLQEQK